MGKRSLLSVSFEYIIVLDFHDSRGAEGGEGVSIWGMKMRTFGQRSFERVEVVMRRVNDQKG